MSTSQLQRAFLAAILIFAGAFRLALLNVPFGRNPEGCAAFFGLVARNYFRYPVSAHYGVPITSMGQGAPVVYYANHPPTTPLLIGAVHAMTGYHGGFDTLPGDWQVRLPTAIFTIACIALIYVLVRNRAGPTTGLLAAALFAAIPMTLVYGGFPDVISPQLVFFILLTVAAYERFHDAPSAKTLGILTASFIGAAIMDWPAFLIVPVFGIHFLLTRRPKTWGWIIGFGLLSVAVFGLLYVYLATAQHNWMWMKSLVQRRSISTANDPDHQFGFAQWFAQAIWRHAIGRHTLTLSVLALIGLMVAVMRRATGRLDRMMILLLCWAGVHVLVGAQGVYKHEWWWWPLTPGLVMAGAIGLEQVLNRVLALGVSVKAARIGTVIALICFTAWNARAAVHELIDPTLIPKEGGPLSYSLKDIGHVIRTHTAPDASVMVTDTDDSLGFWYYADRGVKMSVWESDTFQRRISDPTVDLSFNVLEHFEGPTQTMIIPKFYVGKYPQYVAPMAASLEMHYERTETPQYLIYDLSKPKLNPTTRP